MSFLVVAYPRFTDDDRHWIDAIRVQHDPHVSLIDPHFTLVFPTDSHGLAGLLDELRQQAAHHTAFSFVIRCALAVKDQLSPQTHVFLVPDEGFSRLVRLHNALYAVSLAPTRRLDIPFIPHITVGATPALHYSAAIADAINRDECIIKGVIDQLSVLTFDGHTVELCEHIPLYTR